MASRDDFIAQMIAALQENEALAAGGASSAPVAATSDRFVSAPRATDVSTTAAARTAYDALQLDFPLVSDDQLTALAEVYRSIVEKRAGESEAAAAAFPVTATMVDAIEYLNDSMDKRRGTEASGLLAAALLLLVPRLCVTHPQDVVCATLLRQLRVPTSSRAKPATKETEEGSSLLDQFTQKNEAKEDEETTFSGGFVEIYAAEEDPDDLSLVYEGSQPVAREFPTAYSQNGVGASHRQTTTPPPRSAQLRLLASKTYSTCFSQISSAKWVEWQLHDALSELIQRLVAHPDDEEEYVVDQGGEKQRLHGEHGEWQRYLFVLRDQLLRFVDHHDACASGLKTLKALVEWTHSSASSTTKHSAPPPTHDPFFSFGKSAAASTAAEVVSPAQDTLKRIVFRVLAELAVSKEFNSLSARRAQHTLALTIQQLFPVILRELQRLSPLLTKPAFASTHGDFVVVQLQLLHFVVVAADSSAESQRLAIDKLQDSGLLRAWLAFVPSAADTKTLSEWPWVAPQLRLFGESALWNNEFASYLQRVPKITTLLQILRADETLSLSCEALLLGIAAAQHSLPLSGAPWTEQFASERIFPSACGSYAEAMQKMSDAVFLLDVLAKAVSSMRAPVAEQLRLSLQSIYSSRFPTAFQYPTFAVPDDSPRESELKDEPEPPPTEEAERGDAPHAEDEAEERGRAEALQFVALRNRLRQCAKTVLLSRFTGASSSKLD